MLGNWWGRTIIKLISYFLLLLGVVSIAAPKVSNGFGFIVIIIGLVLYGVYISSYKKAKIYNDELIREKARRGRPL